MILIKNSGEEIHKKGTLSGGGRVEAVHLVKRSREEKKCRATLQAGVTLYHGKRGGGRGSSCLSFQKKVGWGLKGRVQTNRRSKNPMNDPRSGGCRNIGDQVFKTLKRSRISGYSMIRGNERGEK